MYSKYSLLNDRYLSSTLLNFINLKRLREYSFKLIFSITNFLCLKILANIKSTSSSVVELVIVKEYSMNNNNNNPNVNWQTPKGTIIDGYDATPPSVNMKCIVFTLITVLAYLFFPKKVECLVPFGIILVYLYSRGYECKNNLLMNILLGTVYGIILLQKKNKWVLLLLLYFPYLVLAIYDYQFDCKRNKFGPTFLANYYSWAKPMYSDQIKVYNNWHPKWKSLVNKVDLVILLIILILTPKFLKWKFK